MSPSARRLPTPQFRGLRGDPGALPTGSLVFVLASQYGVYVSRATAAILVSTVFSVVTLWVLLALLEVG